MLFQLTEKSERKIAKGNNSSIKRFKFYFIYQILDNNIRNDVLKCENFSLKGVARIKKRYKQTYRRIQVKIK